MIYYFPAEFVGVEYMRRHSGLSYSQVGRFTAWPALVVLKSQLVLDLQPDRPMFVSPAVACVPPPLFVSHKQHPTSYDSMRTLYLRKHKTAADSDLQSGSPTISIVVRLACQHLSAKTPSKGGQFYVAVRTQAAAVERLPLSTKVAAGFAC